MEQGFVVGIYYSVLAIQVALPLLASLVDGKEIPVNNGPVAFHQRVFRTEILHRVQLPTGFLQKCGTNRIITCIHVNYELLVQSW